MLIWFSWTGMLLGVVSLNLMQEIITSPTRTARRLDLRPCRFRTNERRPVRRPFHQAQQLGYYPGPERRSGGRFLLGHGSKPALGRLHRLVYRILRVCLPYGPCLRSHAAGRIPHSDRQALMTALVLIRGAGDLASGVALRLLRAGLNVVMTELEQPLAVRRTVSFAEAIHQGQADVEGVTARRITDAADLSSILNCISAHEIPVLIDPHCAAAMLTHPLVIVDARMTKKPPEPLQHAALLYIGLGPGFLAPANCHAVVETQRGHSMGRVIWEGAAHLDSMQPDGDTRPRSTVARRRVLQLFSVYRPTLRTWRHHRFRSWSTHHRSVFWHAARITASRSACTERHEGRRHRHP